MKLYTNQFGMAQRIAKNGHTVNVQTWRVSEVKLETNRGINMGANSACDDLCGKTFRPCKASLH